jgi:RHS repeat-associated protein
MRLSGWKQILILALWLLIVQCGQAHAQVDTISGISPTSGPVGSAVVISGLNFGSSQGSSTVSLNGTSAVVTAWADTSITAIVPSGASSGSFSVVVNQETATSTTFTVTPLPSGWSDADVGSVGVAGSASYANGVFAVNASGQGIKNSADAMHFAYQPLSGNGTIVARVVSVTGTTTAQAGVMIRETLNAGATMAFVDYENSSYSYDNFYYRATTGASAQYQAITAGQTLPYWVELVRSGNTFTAYASSDGLNWIQAGSTETITMAQNVYIGLAVSSDNNSTLATAKFDNVSVSSTSAPVITNVSATTGSVGTQVIISGSGFGATQGNSLVTLNGALVTVNSWSNSVVVITIPSGATSGPLVVSVAPGMDDSDPIVFTVTSQPLPIPWLDQDVGTVGVVGTSSYASEVFTVNASGQAIKYAADAMHFAYQPLSGNGMIVARVVSVTGTTTAQAGVMIRETLNAGATMAFVDYENSSYSYDNFYYRATTGASAQYQAITAGQTLPYWVELVRSGNTFTAYTSLDGVNWQAAGSSETITMAQNVYIGLAVSSDNNSTLATAKFDNVSVSSTSAPAPVITNVSATTGSVGSQVAIAGSGFVASQGSSVVTLNGVPVTVNAWGSTAIIITIPSGATSGPLVVSVAPNMDVSNPVEFTITSHPLPIPWLDQDVGSVGVAGSATYANGVFTVNGSGNCMCSTVDAMHFVYQPLSGDGTIVARVVSFQSTTGRAGVTIRETLDASATDAYVFYWSPYITFNNRSSSTGGNNAQVDEFYAGQLPYWVMLVRSGNNFSAYVSEYGFSWSQVGSTQTISMAQAAYIGLGVTANSASSLTTATFDNVSITSAANPPPVITGVSATTGSVGSQVAISGSGFGASQSGSLVLLNGAAVTVNSWSATSIIVTIPSGATSGLLVVSLAPSMNDSNPVEFTVTAQPLPTAWLDEDVGAVTLAGSASYTNSVFTVNASGNCLCSTADAMHFVYQPLSGDGTIVARVVSVSGPSTAEAGVMIRETLNPGATDAYADYQSSYISAYSRLSTGGTNVYANEVYIGSLPYWIKVVRSGSSFAQYESSNGTSWTQVGSTQTITMASNTYIGLFVTNVNNSSLATATFDNVSVTIGTTPFVTGLSPVLGGIGSSVTITGSDFGTTQGTSTVSFNGIVASSITSWSSAQIVAAVPTGATTGPVAVTVNSIQSVANPTFTVIHPAISSVTPPSSQTYGIVKINGSGFGANLANSYVSFNGTQGYVISWSDTSLSVQIWPGTTTGPTTVVEDGVSSNSVQFTILEALSVTGVSPSSGMVGSTVTISGAGFGATQSTSTLTFNTTPATVTAWSDTSITAVVPTGASTGPVTAEVAGSTALGPVFTLTGSVQLTDSLGHQSTYASQLAGGKWYVNNSQGSGCSSCTVRGSIQNQYDSFGNITQTTDELGNVTSYAHDSNNNVTLITQPAVNGTNPKTSYTYNSFGEPLTVTDPLGNFTTNSYDAHGNLLAVATPAPNSNTAPSVTQFAYNSLGELTQITDPLGRITKLAYTSVGLIYTITDSQNNVTTYAYDSRGNRTSVTDAMNNQTTFAYDSWNRLLTIAYPGNATTTFTYDYRGRRTSVTDQNSKKTTYAYDDEDRLTSVTDPNNNVTRYTYDTENNLLSIEDASNHTTSFAYDAYGRVTETTFPSTHYEQYGYDAANNLTSKTDRNGHTINYVYDDLYRLTQKTYPDSSTVEYVYDLVGKLQQVTDPTGTYGFAYDNMGRLVGTTTKYTFLSSNTYSNSYSYDAGSNRVSMTDPQNGVTSYAYDTLNRLSTLTPPTAFGSGSFGFSYDPLSRRTQMTRPNGVTTNYTYDNLSRLLSVLHQLGASTIDGATYTVDPVGNRTAKIDKHANVTSNYTYDPLYELTQVTQTTTTETYSYDPVGNRLSSLGVSPYSYNSSNELTSTPSTTYTYDNNGDTLTKVTSAGTTTYGWDYENRMTSVTLPGTGGTLAFKYDALGHRVQKTFTQGSTTTTTNYLYDRSNAVADVDQNANVLARYTATQNIDEPLAELRSSTTSYYEADGLSSVTSLTTSAGALGNTYTYDSFGKLTGSSGSIANRFQYTAREFDPETGIYSYRARYYDQTTGRFLSEDPTKFWGGVNFYDYTYDSPTNLTDPSGKIVWIPVIVGAAGAIAGGYSEGHKGYKCGDRGWKLAGDIGRGAASGAVGAVAGLAAAVLSDNPFVGGAAGSVAFDVSISALGGGFNLASTAEDAAFGAVFGGVGEGLAQELLPVQGGSNFNAMLSRRTFGARAGQLYGGEAISHGLNLGKDPGSDCGCK